MKTQITKYDKKVSHSGFITRNLLLRVFLENKCKNYASDKHQHSYQDNL